MRKLVLFIFLMAFLAILATCSMSEGNGTKTPTPTLKMVNAIVAQPAEATFTFTPDPTSTPTPTATLTRKPVNAIQAETGTATVTATPTESATLTAPSGWVVYTNDAYGFEFAHPDLYDCKGYEIRAFINLGDIQPITTLAVESTISPNDAPFDGLSINVFLNPNAIPLEDFVEQEKQAILAGPTFIGPPLGLTPLTVGGQTGVEMSLAGNIPSAIYIPFPDSHEVMIVSIGEQHAGSFIETAKQILSTLRFTK